MANTEPFTITYDLYVQIFSSITGRRLGRAGQIYRLPVHRLPRAVLQVPRVQRCQVGRSARSHHRPGPEGCGPVRGGAEQPSGACPDCQLQLAPVRSKLALVPVLNEKEAPLAFDIYCVP